MCAQTTLRMYIDMMKSQDTQFAHKFYQQAFNGTAKILLHLLDNSEELDAYLLSLEHKEEEKSAEGTF